MKTRAIIAGAALALALSACTSESTPEVTPAPSDVETTAASEPTPTPSPTPEVVESTGTRAAPLHPGESRKLSEASAFTITLTGANLDAAASILAADQYATKPADGETFVVGTFSVAVDGAAIAAQGYDITETGVDPWSSLTIEFVSADGTGYGDTTGGTLCYTTNPLYQQPTIYQDGGSVTGDVCFAVPTDKASRPGGLWRISNSVGDALWIASS